MTITSTATKKRRTWPYVVAIPVALCIGVGIGYGIAPTATVASTVTASPATNAGGSLPAVSAPTYPPAPAYVPSGPLTTFSDGIYEVGTSDGQIAPGKYRSDNPNGNGYIWLTKADGSHGDDASSKGQILVTITKTDTQAEVYGCTFVKA